MHDRGAVTALFLSVSDERRGENAKAIAFGFKRLGDIVGASLAIVIFMPFMVAIAGALWLSGTGRIFCGNARVGQFGRRFNCLKFRTTHLDRSERLAALRCGRDAAAQRDRTRKFDREPRISRVGRLLRASSLDELPQLFNVLKGDMSLVGPRPVTADELMRYGTSVGGYLSVLPGLTGLWQVNGCGRLTYWQRVRLDADYARNWSLGADVLILLRTPGAVFVQRAGR